MKARSPTAAIALALSAIALHSAHAQDSIIPGYWETTDRSPVGTKTERRCITPNDVAKFMRGPSNHIYACTYPQQTIGGGVITFRGECVDRKGQRVQLSGHGVYTHNILSMTANVSVRLLGIPLTLTASTDARRLGDTCPGPAKPPRRGSPG